MLFVKGKAVAILYGRTALAINGTNPHTRNPAFRCWGWNALSHNLVTIDGNASLVGLLARVATL